MRRLCSSWNSLAAAEIVHLCDPEAAGTWLGEYLLGQAEPDARVARLDWPDPAQRLANIEGLYNLAGQYEEANRAAHRAATPGGFVAWLQSSSRLNCSRPSFGDDAVSVLTNHKAKGFEWPVVVMTQLGHDRASTAFEVTVEEPAVFDVAAPPAGRWGPLLALAMWQAYDRPSAERPGRRLSRAVCRGIARCRNLSH